ncbi:MAG: tetratricopeptide repeat protein [Myxococcales bacterium]|nr:tetratricopeptide repeat protein [Myxococcales bacterium]
MSRNYLWAGGFLAVTLALIIQGAVSGVGASLSRSHQQAKAEQIADREALKSAVADGIVLGEQGDFQGAMNVFEQLAVKYPQHAAVWLNLGIARGAMGNIIGAEAAFQWVLRMSPQDYDALAELANIALQRGDIGRAVALAKDIPMGEGRLRERLASDERWLRYQHDHRVVELRRQYGLPVVDTSERARKELERAMRR